MHGTPVRDALRLFRAQTAAVEGAGFPLAAWIGGAPLWTLPLFAVLGILSHFGGFGENGITDLAYDRLDPSKADHPLVTGRMRFRRGLTLVYGCQVAGIALFLSILFGHATDVTVPLFAFVGYVFLGHVYNFTGKWWKPGAVLEISGSFTLAFLAVATAWTGRTSMLVVVVAAYAFIFTAFQIAVAGELKELAQANEKNLLRRLGMAVVSPFAPLFQIADSVQTHGDTVAMGDRTPPRHFLTLGWPPYGGLLAIALSMAKAAALGVVAWLVAGPLWGFVVWSVTLVAFIFYTWALLRPGSFDRPKRVRTMGIGEASSYLFLVLAVMPLLLPWLWVLFIVLPVAWFVGLNRMLWSGSGSAWAPGV